MDEDRCLHASRELAGLDGGVEFPVESRKVQGVERRPREQRAMEHRCWPCGCCDHAAAKCPSPRYAVGK